jgi:hypothetical protein
VFQVKASPDETLRLVLEYREMIEKYNQYDAVCEAIRKATSFDNLDTRILDIRQRGIHAGTGGGVLTRAECAEYFGRGRCS